MPNNGLIIAWDELSLSCSGNVSYSGSGAGVGTYSYSTTASTSYAPNAIDVATGIYLHCESSFDGTTGSWQVVYDGPGAPFGGYIVSGSGYQSTSIAAVLKNLKIYSQLTGSSYRITWTAIDIYVNGALNITLPGSGIDASSAGVGQNYIPIIGVPLEVSGGCSAGRTGIDPFVFDACAPGEFEPQSYVTHSSGSCSGGWKFKEVGSDFWQTLPVAIHTEEAPAGGGCPFNLSTSGVVSGSNTGSVSIECESFTQYDFTYEGRSHIGYPRCRYICPDDSTIYDNGYGSIVCYDECTGEAIPYYSPHVYKMRTQTRSQSGRVRIVPNLSKAIKLHKAGYRALWLRLALPYANGSASRHCEDGAVTIDNSSTPNVYPFKSEFLGAVGDGLHAIEDAFGYDTYCPISVSKSKSDNTTFDESHLGYQLPPLPGCIITCPELPDPECEYVAGGFGYDPLPTEHLEESVSYAFPTDVGPEGNYQWHYDKELRYLGTWCNLHWHYLFFHADWSGISYADYWGPGRQQWIWNASLPPDEQLSTRSDMIGSCHEESGHTPFLDAFVGGFRWIGASRWKVRKPTIPSEKATDATGSSRWTFGDLVEGEYDGSGSVGTTVTLDAGTTKATVEVLDFNSVPYLYPLICDRVRIDNDFDNVASFTVSAVGFDGKEKVICTSTGTFDLPKIKAKKYAGSWGIDNGLGVVDDLGVDTNAKGISSAIMADAEACIGFELLPSTGLARIKFTVVPIDPDEPCTVPHPVFLKSAKTPIMVWESAQICALLFEDGGMIRLGNWTWYVPGLGLQNPPLLSGAGYKSTIIDALCTLRVIWEAKAHDDGLTTELTSLYDTYEGQSVGVVDKFSVAYPLATDNGFPFALVNTMSETPPLCCFPNKSWNSTNWTQTGDYKLEVWDWTQEPRYLITCGDIPADLYDSSDTKWTSPFSGTGVSGWTITEHSHAVTNFESVDFKIKKGTKEYAEVTPWRGYSSILDIASLVNAPSYDVSSSMRHYLGYIKDDNRIWLKRSNNITPFDWEESDTGLDGSAICVRVDRSSKTQTIFLIFADEGDIKLASSLDEGRTWTMPTTIAPGTFPALFISQSGIKFIYWTDGTDIKGQIMSPQDDIIQDTFTAISGIDDDTGISADESYTTKGLPRITLAYIEGGETKTQSSADGKSFS